MANYEWFGDVLYIDRKLAGWLRWNPYKQMWIGCHPSGRKTAYYPKRIDAEVRLIKIIEGKD